MMYTNQTNSMHYIHIHDNVVDTFNIVFSVAAAQTNTPLHKTVDIYQICYTFKATII